MARKKSVAVKTAVVTTVLRPVATRLDRIEDLLIEVRLVLDLHLKRIDMIQRQVDMLTEPVRLTGLATRRGKR